MNWFTVLRKLITPSNTAIRLNSDLRLVRSVTQTMDNCRGFPFSIDLREYLFKIDYTKVYNPLYVMLVQNVYLVNYPANMNHNSGVHLAFFKRNIIPGANTITDIVSLLIQVINKILFDSEEY